MGRTHPRSPRRRKEGEIEIRQLFELEDFGPSEAIDRTRAGERAREKEVVAA